MVSADIANRWQDRGLESQVWTRNLHHMPSTTNNQQDEIPLKGSACVVSVGVYADVVVQAKLLVDVLLLRWLGLIFS